MLPEHRVTPYVTAFHRSATAFAVALGLLGLFLAAGCSSAEREPVAAADSALQERPTPAATADVPTESVAGQTVYVPVYSHIYYLDGSREFNLTATLSIRNTDLDHPIAVTAVRYHDSGGQLVRRYLEQPLQLPPLASQPFVVEEQDKVGGVGANFIVEWESGAVVSPPIIEAVMISTSSTQGISFVSRGQVVRPLEEANEARQP